MLLVVHKSTNASSSALKAPSNKWPGAELPVKISKIFDQEWQVAIYLLIISIL